MHYRPYKSAQALQTLLLGRNAPLTVPGFSLDANGAFRPKQRALQHRRLDLRPGTHPILEQAEIRAACLEAIDPKLDFGDDRSLPNLKTQIEQLQDQINLYNTELTALDHIRSDIKAREKKLSELSSQMLLGVAFRYGRDSQEYQMAGGVRKSEQIRRRYLARLKANDIAPETTA